MTDPRKETVLDMHCADLATNAGIEIERAKDSIAQIVGHITAFLQLDELSNDGNLEGARQAYQMLDEASSILDEVFG
jgi:hypothetical protein